MYLLCQIRFLIAGYDVSFIVASNSFVFWRVFFFFFFDAKFLLEYFTSYLFDTDVLHLTYLNSSTTNSSLSSLPLLVTSRSILQSIS